MLLKSCSSIWFFVIFKKIHKNKKKLCIVTFNLKVNKNIKLDYSKNILKHTSL